MKKRTTCIITISLIALILGAFVLSGRFFLPKEMLVNKRVQESIEKQLQGVDLESIRAKRDFIMEQSVSELQDAVLSGKLTYEELTAFYLDRIRQFDLGEYGLHAVLEINPKAMELPRAWDESPKRGQGISGIPVLIKDNINTKTMPTSGGTWALKDYTPKTNASVVDNLVNNGALILGKANLAELANFMSNAMPNGYSSKVGQTNNPFGPGTISPEGSSSGSGAALAANLSALAVGSETVGSIIAPADIQSVVGFKPTVGKIPTEGVIPLAPTTDTLGPMAKNVPDAVELYNGMIN